MTASARRWIALASVGIVLALATGTATAAEAAGKGEAAADPPWLLLAGVALVGTFAVGGLAAFWARKLERAGHP